jgi:hypothetical protein
LFGYFSGHILKILNNVKLRLVGPVNLKGDEPHNKENQYRDHSGILMI